MEGTRGRRTLWVGAGGLVLIALGIVWDQIWHSANGDDELGSLSEVLSAHWLIFLGALTVFAATLAAVRGITAPGAARVFARFAAIGSLAIVVGLVSDTVEHYRGTEMDLWHLVSYGGLLVAVIAVVAALVASRPRVPSDQPSSAE